MIVTGQTKIARNGEITHRTTNGDFAQGERLIAAVARLMQKTGAKIDVVTPTEQHRHDDTDPIHAHDHTHSH